MRERFIRTNGVMLHVMEDGPEDGPVILFLHGFPEFWYSWRRQIDYFARRGYLVAVPDQRGYNLSDKPEAIDSYREIELSNDVAGLIKQYGRKKVFLVGHDWGGLVAWWTASLFPESIERLVILNVPHPQIASRNILTNPKQMRLSWYMYYFQLPDAAEKLAALNDYNWFIQMLSKSSCPGAFSEEDLVKYREAFKQPGALRSMINWYRATAMLRSDVPEPLRVTMPMLLLWGVKDVALLPELADQSLIYCDQGRLIKFNEATHWLQHEEAERINPIIDDFFKGH